MVSQALMRRAGAGYNHGNVLVCITTPNAAINYGSLGGFRESRALNPISCYECLQTLYKQYQIQ